MKGDSTYDEQRIGGEGGIPRSAPRDFHLPELTRRQALLMLGGGVLSVVAGGTAGGLAKGLVSPREAAAANAAAGAIANAAANAAATVTYRVPPEHARHTRTWMAWPDSRAIWGRRLLPKIQADIALIAATVAKYEPVIMCANRASVAKARSKCGSRVKVIGSIPVSDCWMRDSGPVFRVNGGGGLDAVGLNFNGWGEKQAHARDALVAKRIAAYVGVPFTKASLVAEGGAVEADGHGTLLATKSSIINGNRNPGMTQEQIEAALCAAYGTAKVIWCPGIKGKDITDDHIDATSRFIGDHKALVQIPQPEDSDIWSNDAREQLQILSSSTGAQGDPVDVTTIQGPDYGKVRVQSEDFLASYANYYVCNGAVIMQNTGDTASDRAARATLAALFPRRVVRSLVIDHLCSWGGGIHCVTQQQPAR